MHSSRQLKTCPRTINFDRRTSIGKLAIILPNIVKSPSNTIFLPLQVDNNAPHCKCVFKIYIT